MHFLNISAVALVVSPLLLMPSLALAASAHNSQAGSYGPSSNASDSTPDSPRVKHSAKHKNMHEKM